MGDVAQILKNAKAGSLRTDGSSAAAPSLNPTKAMKMMGMPKEVLHLLSGNQDTKSADLPPIVPSFLKENSTAHSAEESGAAKEVKVKVGNKWISSTKTARPWTWAPFASSSRTDGAMFRHWVRANVEYTDYPYAKFDIHLDPVTYTDEEFASYLKSESWTRSETDTLMELVRKYELRWAVIHDRWFDHYYSQENGETSAMRKIEDLQERYYTVAAKLSQIRISQEAAAEVQALSAINPDQTAPDVKEKTEQIILETAAARSLATAAPNAQPLLTNLGTGSTNKVFDVNHERERRANLDRLWKRSKEEEIEELELRKELRAIDAQLRKLKKAGVHIVAASGGRGLSSAASSRNPSRSVSPIPGAKIVDNPDTLNQSFASNSPVPMPQTPYLQSGRLAPPATGGSAGLNKSMLTRMQQVLAELKVPSRLLPTKRVCDLYDSVRKDALILITLQKMVMQKEGNLQSKRVKLSKLGVGESHVLDEEALLGIAPPPAPAATIPTSTSKKTSKSTKSKTSTSGAKARNTTSKAKNSDDSGTKTDSKATKDTTTKKTKATPKRKRKSESAAPKDTKKGQTATAAAGVSNTPKTTSTKTGNSISSATSAKTSKSPASTDATGTGSAKKRARKS